MLHNFFVFIYHKMKLILIFRQKFNSQFVIKILQYVRKFCIKYCYKTKVFHKLCSLVGLGKICCFKSLFIKDDFHSKFSFEMW